MADMSAKVEKHLWSESSRSTDAYWSAADEPCIDEFYEDDHYACRKCGAACVFTGEAQKIFYEQRKAFIRRGWTLCDPCYLELRALLDNISIYRQLWANESPKSKLTAPYIDGWLHALTVLPAYGRATDQGMLRRLQKLSKTYQQQLEAEAKIDHELLFYDSLGAELTDRPCKKPGCTRGHIYNGVFCRSHHVEMLFKRPCRFWH